MQKSLLLFLGLILLISSQTYYISPFGSDNNNGLSSGSPFETFRKALTVGSSRNRTIYIQSGQYIGNENLFLTTPSTTDTLTIIGANRELVIFNCLLSANDAWRFEFSSLSISNITFKSCKGNTLYLAGSNKRKAFFSNVLFNNCTKGIYVNSPNVNLTVNGSLFQNGGTGIGLNDGNIVLNLTNNVFELSDYGITQTNYLTILAVLTGNYFGGNKLFHVDMQGRVTNWIMRENLFYGGQFNINNVDNFEMNGVSYLYGNITINNAPDNKIFNSNFDNVQKFVLNNAKTRLLDSRIANGKGLRVRLGTLYAKNVRFEQNYNETTGGALTIEDSVVNIEESEFTSNIGNRSGAIYCLKGNGNIFSSTFASNVALREGFGGAFYCEKDCEILFVRNRYSDNKPIWSSPKCQAN